MSQSELKWIKCPNCDKDHLVAFGTRGFAEYGVGDVVSHEGEECYTFEFVDDNCQIMLIGPGADVVQKLAVRMVANGVFEPRGGLGEFQDQKPKPTDRSKQ